MSSPPPVDRSVRTTIHGTPELQYQRQLDTRARLADAYRNDESPSQAGKPLPPVFTRHDLQTIREVEAIARAAMKRPGGQP